MRTLRVNFPASAPGGRVCVLSACFGEHDLGDFDDVPDADTLCALITCNGREFEPTAEGSYRARGGGPVLHACDARYRWPTLRLLAVRALVGSAH